MSGRGTALALALVIGAVPAFADNARPRSGGSSGGGSSAGARHHSGGSGSSSSGYRSGGGPSHSGGASRPPSGAQYRHPRAGTGTGNHYYGYGYRHGYPYYGYRPYYYGYGPYWGNYGYDYYPYSYGGYYGYGYGYAPGYGYSSGGYGYSSGGYGYSEDSGAVRTFVEPSETKIFLDGRYAGTADDFDSMFQRLYAAPGAHELMLKLEGYKTHRVKLYLSPGATLKLHHDMVKGSGEDAKIDTLGNPEDERFGKRDRRWDDDPYDDEVRGQDRRPENDNDSDQEVRQDPPRVEDQPRAGFSVGRDDAGTVRLAIQPGDASVYVDGQFRGAAERVRSLGLSAGKHRIEVVRPGFRTIEREVDVRDGEETTLEVELSRS